MKDKLKELASSKKFLAMIGGLIVVLAAKLGLEVSNETATELTAIVVAYLVGQGVADHGKEAAKAATPAPPAPGKLTTSVTVTE